MNVLQASQFAFMGARIAELGLKYRLPTISGEPGFAQSGGLMTYGPKHSRSLATRSELR